MIKSTEVRKGTIAELKEDTTLYLFLDNDTMYGNVADVPLTKGTQLIFENKPKKQSTYLLASFKISKNNEIVDHVFHAYWSYINSELEIVFNPDNPNAKASFKESEISLNDNEEYCFLLKENKEYYMKSLGEPFYDDEESFHGFVVTKKKGQRKRIKNRQSLNGFLNGFSSYTGRDFLEKLHRVSSKEYKHNYNNLLSQSDEYYNGVGQANESQRQSLINKMELYKYNKDTKKVYDVPVQDFSIADYIQKLNDSMKWTLLYGSAVSSVVKQLRNDDCLQEYPLIASFRYDSNELKTIGKYPYVEFEAVPQEKDIYVDLAFKKSGLKKKDFYVENKAGFSAVAFKNKEDMENYLGFYKNKEKVTVVLNVSDILESNLPPILQEAFNKANYGTGYNPEEMINDEIKSCNNFKAF